MAFHSAAGSVQAETDTKTLGPRILLARAYGAYIAATRLALSGQTLESYMAIRATIEIAWYALHMFADPDPPNRFMIWMGRHGDAAAKSRCQTEFQIENVRRTHATVDPAAEQILGGLYGETIDLGAHPNPRGVWGTVRHEETVDALTFEVDVFNADHERVASALSRVVGSAIGALATFYWIFPKQFGAASLPREISHLIRDNNAVVRAWPDQAASAER